MMALKNLLSNEELISMIKYCMDHKKVHVYIVHGVDEPEILPGALPDINERASGDKTDPPTSQNRSP